MASYNFSNDVLFEILSRTELKTMKKCRILSKECKDLTFESSFTRLHAQRTTTMVGYLLQSLRRANRVDSLFLSIDNPDLDRKITRNFLDFLSERVPVEILATVDEGLVFCCTRQFRADKFYICKPSTQQSEVVPSPNPRHFTEKVGMLVLGSNPLRFKIVRLSDAVHDEVEHARPTYSEVGFDDECYGHKRYHCEIFDSKSWEWKQSDDLMLSYYDVLNNKPAVSAQGGLHWLMYNMDQCNYNILSFYGDNDNWATSSLPDFLCRNNRRSTNLATCEGGLALICVDRDSNSVDVWVSKDCFWIKKLRVNLESFSEEIGHVCVNSFYNADTLFIIGLWTAIFYNFKTRESKNINLPLNYQTPELVYFIQSDFELVRFKLEEGKEEEESLH
ncbi:hypothetical protein HRI_002610100 [Hibiscus trionum]|uniref:F-box associated beta-propeller type 1 domain-containing protein n=1 Tax=Hibiscus trionum TaxID=183268 RepID=A0A9W7I7I3_HIBTR|nr:hypothetical protein HRI_002610100 [Hibiscus trionum]